jgi:predicted short-subunit dehydrogenase-like oxidoreductase (DUF2520 family)
MKNNIYICGNGNVGSALVREFARHRIEVSGIYSRSKDKKPENVEKICRYGTDFPEKNAIVFITVPDSYIGETEKNLGKGDFYVVHTAGSVPLDALASRNSGVFYPLQTFSLGVKVNWEGLPVMVETNDEELLEALFEIVAAFGARGMECDSAQRAALHVSAVFANNFSNAMFAIAENIAKNAGFSADILSPLIRQTVKKLELLHADEAQTGPAKRGDKKVLEKHLKMLEEKPEFAVVYRAVSDYIGNAGNH